MTDKTNRLKSLGMYILCLFKKTKEIEIFKFSLQSKDVSDYFSKICNKSYSFQTAVAFYSLRILRKRTYTLIHLSTLWHGIDTLQKQFGEVELVSS